MTAPVAVVDGGSHMRPGRWMLALLLVFAIAWFGGLGHRKLIKPDEGRYAEIPREMVVSGDWLTPRLNGLKYFEKPPLQYWTTAAAYETFGVSEWTSRLWTALTGFAGVLVVGFTATRLYDRRTGLFSATVLASGLAYVLLGHFNTLDMGLALFITMTWCAVLLARDARVRDDDPDAHCGSGRRGRPSHAKRWMMVAWAAMALATLSKGPVAVVLSGGALVAYLVMSRDWKLLGMLAPVRGLALFVLIAGPWFIAVSRANPEFAHFFFIHEHVERFLTTEHRREGPIWYFVPVLLAGLLPWLSVAAPAMLLAWRAPARGGFAPERLMLALIGVVFVFFSLSGSKLPSYILPVFPAFAILIGRRLATIGRAALKRHLIFIAVLAVVAVATIAFVPLDSSDSADAIAAFRLTAFASMTAWLVGTLIAIGLALRDRATGAIVAAGLAALVGWSSLLLGHEVLGRGMSTYDLARDMKPFIAADTPIYSVGLFEHTLDFYLQRPVTLVAFRDELDFGLTQEPHQGIATLPAFIARWNADRAPLAIMADDVFDTLTVARLPMRVVARDGRRIVVGKPPADPTDAPQDRPVPPAAPAQTRTPS
ncbi:MAG: glycosyltransferase family 39 protein [Burkholderiaceae bacterium]